MMYNRNEDKFPKMIERRAIYESDWISLYSDKVEMPDGQVIPAYHRLHYSHESVSCVIVNENDEILLIQSKRYTTGHLEWEIPAGRIEQGESAEEAARRECLEETGCTVKELTFLCKQNPSNGMSDLTIHVFGAKVDTETMEFDKNEVSRKQWLPLNRVMELLRDNEIRCGVSMLSLLYAIQFYIK